MDIKDYKNNNLTNDLQSYMENHKNFSYGAELDSLSKLSIRETIIIACYSIIVIISIFGNLLVCNIVARRASMRRTTYVFIANLAMSDLLMTVLNIPFNVARVLLNDWPFGDFMCSFVPLIQVTSVYVSTFTMMFIALDRYRVICKPLKPRMGPAQALKAIVFVWFVAVLLSLPHAIFNKVRPVITYRPLIRCRTVYPTNLRRWITLITVTTQYVLPLSITGIVYSFIVARVWSRDALGVVTEAQLVTQARAKRKTIKMLLLVVILFALCWLPLNVYHLLQEFTTLEFTYKSSTIYFICHWLAMSSVCYNPFIYCWLNKHFRSGAIACFMCIRNVGRKLNSSFRSSREFKISGFQCDLASQSYDSRTDSIQRSKDNNCCCKTEQPLHKSRSFELGSKKGCPKESVPLRSFYVAKFTNDSAVMLIENNKLECNSVPEMETSNFDSRIKQLPLKKCISWSK